MWAPACMQSQGRRHGAQRAFPLWAPRRKGAPMLDGPGTQMHLCMPKSLHTISSKTRAHGRGAELGHQLPALKPLSRGGQGARKRKASHFACSPIAARTYMF